MPMPDGWSATEFGAGSSILATVATILFLAVKNLPAFLESRSKRTSNTVQAAGEVQDMSLEMLREFRSRLQEATAETIAAKHEAQEARREVGKLRDEVEELRDVVRKYARVYGPVPA